MKRNTPSTASADKGVRKGLWLLLGAGVLLTLALAGIQFGTRDAADNSETVSESEATDVAASVTPAGAATPARVEANVRTGGVQMMPAVESIGIGNSAGAPAAVAPIQRPELPPPSAESRRLVSAIWQPSSTGMALTDEERTLWKRNFEQLVRGGAASVSAITEFLKLNQDWMFHGTDSAALGYGSAREALLHALVQIGGAEGIGAMGDLLQSTAVPREIALLAKYLESLAPDQYRHQAIEAARQTLSMAVQKNLEGFDVAPLFEVLQSFGGPEIARDLQQAASHWNYYATLALGKLPDGAGVPTLIQMVELSPEGKAGPGRLQALQVLAEMASLYPDARAALIQQVGANQIAPNLWPYLIRPLSGDQAHVQDTVLDENLPHLAQTSTGSSHIRHNNQNFFYAPIGGGLTVELAQQQIELVNELAAVASTPEARKVLDQARMSLQQRLTTAALALTPGQNN